MHARLTLVDGTVIEHADQLAFRPATLYYTVPGPLGLIARRKTIAESDVRQIEVVEDDGTVRGPLPEDISRLPI